MNRAGTGKTSHSHSSFTKRRSPGPCTTRERFSGFAAAMSLSTSWVRRGCNPQLLRWFGWRPRAELGIRGGRLGFAWERVPGPGRGFLVPDSRGGASVEGWGGAWRGGAGRGGAGRAGLPCSLPMASQGRAWGGGLGVGDWERGAGGWGGGGKEG